MKKLIKNIAIVFGLSSLLFVACKDDIPPIIEKLDFQRVFTPIELSARIRNMTTVELNWYDRGDAQKYIVEFSEDSLEFTNIIATVEVNPDELPFKYRLAGEKQYSARVKGVNDTIPENSNWASIAFETDPENILSPVANEDIKAKTVTLRWPAGEEATHFIIQPGGTERPITAEEISAGEATISGLIPETEYVVTMKENESQRGEVNFTTLIDLEGVIQLFPEDDINAAVQAAEDGAVFVLHPGEYEAFQGIIYLSKSISVKGMLPYDKPKTHIQFMVETGNHDLIVTNLDMNGKYIDEDGDEDLLSYAVKYNSKNTTFGNLILQGCVIDNYEKSLLSTSSNNFDMESVLIDNCVVSNVYTDGGDFIDFRQSYCAKLTVTNNTFSNVCTENTRDFIRMDGSTKGNTYDDGTRVPEIVVKNNTIYNVMNSSSSMKRFFYVRWSMHTIESKNNLFANMGVAVYSNQSLTLQPECAYNNYFNAAGFYTDVAGIKYDISDSYTTEDPGFVDPDNGNFTVTNQTVLDNNVGDPRWLGN